MKAPKTQPRGRKTISPKSTILGELAKEKRKMTFLTVSTQIALLINEWIVSFSPGMFPLIG
jgi:hypothetical protein